MKANAGWRQALLASVISVTAGWAVGRWAGLATLGVSLLAMWAVARFATKRIPGLTGDLYGAINEIVELAVLLTWVVIHYFASG